MVVFASGWSRESFHVVFFFPLFTLFLGGGANHIVPSTLRNSGSICNLTAVFDSSRRGESNPTLIFHFRAILRLQQHLLALLNLAKLKQTRGPDK